jgi:hypothetical protein
MEKDMPLWAFIYCSLIALLSIGNIYNNEQRKKYYLPGELLSVLLSIMIFVFYYDVLEKPDPITVVAVMLLFIFYWELWENRHLYPVMTPGRAVEIERDNGANKTEVREGRDRQETVLLVLFLLLLHGPLFYVTFMLLKSYYA